MAPVTCPQCNTRQEIDPDAEGYQCLVCAATWSFVRCTACGQRFHTRPGTRAWTCPNCGTPHGRNRRGISSAGVPLPLLLGGVAAAIVIVVGLILLFTGDDGGAPAPTTPSPSVITDPFRKVCRDLVDVQLLREDALDRASAALTADAAALRAQGDEESAAAVDAIIEAIGSYQEVAAGGGDTVAATNQLLDALDAVDCSGAT